MIFTVTFHVLQLLFSSMDLCTPAIICVSLGSSVCLLVILVFILSPPLARLSPPLACFASLFTGKSNALPRVCIRRSAALQASGVRSERQWRGRVSRGRYVSSSSSSSTSPPPTHTSFPRRVALLPPLVPAQPRLLLTLFLPAPSWQLFMSTGGDGVSSGSVVEKKEIRPRPSASVLLLFLPTPALVPCLHDNAGGGVPARALVPMSAGGGGGGEGGAEKARGGRRAVASCV